MNQVAPKSKKSKVKLNRRGLTEMVLACAFLSLLTVAWWSWQNKGGYVAAMDSGMVEVEVSLWPMIVRSPVIMLSAVVTEFLLLLAVVLAMAPITWWLRTDAVITTAQARTMTPLHWLGEKLHILRPAPVEDEVPGEYTINEAGERVFVPQVNPEDAIDPEQEVVMVEQPDGTLMAMVQQADGTMVPAEEIAKDKAAKEDESTEPLLPLPEQSSDVLNFDEEEEDPLADLADIGDILSAAFDEDSAIDPEREAISRSLEDVDIMELAKQARHVLATFQQ